MLPRQQYVFSFELVLRAFASVRVRGLQFRREQPVSPEYVQRKVTETIVVPVEKPSFLISVYRIVSVVEIKNDFIRRFIHRVRTHIEKKVRRLSFVVQNLLVSFVSVDRFASAFEPVQRALPRHVSARFFVGFRSFACESEQKIKPERVVSVPPSKRVITRFLLTS
jgi:hypothetical protein